MGLRIGYIGAGGFTNAFVFPQLALHGVELAAICDLDEGKARQARGRYGFQSVYTDFRQMLEGEKPDAVFCVGGPKVHYGVGLEVLDRGFPLYVQKPPAPSSETTREMADMAAKRGVVCHVGFNLRSTPAVRQAKAALASEEFGAPRMGIFRYGLCFGATFADAVADQHCHLTDLARFLMGDVEEVTAMRTGREGARDYVVAARFASGAMGTLSFTSGQVVEKEFLYFEVTGEGTFLHSHGCAEMTWVRAQQGPWWRDPRPDLVVRRGAYGGLGMLETLGYVSDVGNFLAAVRGEEEDRSPVASTIGSVALCEEILRQVGDGATRR